MPTFKIKIKYEDTDWMDGYILDLEQHIFRRIIYHIDNPDEIHRNAGFKIARIMLPLWHGLGPAETKIELIHGKLKEDSFKRAKAVKKVLRELERLDGDLGL